MAAITSQNTAQAIVKLVAADVLPALQNELVMGNLVNRSYEDDIASAGDEVNVPIAPAMTANNLAEGGSVQTQNPGLGNAQVRLDTHAESSFTIPDVTRVLAKPDLLSVYSRSSVIALAEKIESDLLDLYSSLTTNTPTGAAGVNLTEDIVDQSERTLFSAKVPASMQKWLVVSPEQYSVLRQIDRFSEFQTIGDAGVEALVRGQVGRLKDFIVLRHQLVKKTGSAPVTTHNIGFVQDAFALVTRQLPEPLPGTGAIVARANLGGFGIRVVMSYAPNTLAQQFTLDALYGQAVIRGEFGVEVKA